MTRLAAALLLAACAAALPARSLLEVRGDYLIYSYDHNYVFGQGGVQLRCDDWTVHARTLDVDVSARLAVVAGDCRVQAGGREYAADLLEIDLESLSLTLVAYGESVRSWTLAGSGRQPGAPPPAPRRLERRPLDELRRSLVYVLNQRLVIGRGFRVHHYQCTVFLEGAQSLSFRKLKLERGMSTAKLRGFWLDRLWYYPSQGLVASTHLRLERPVPAGAAQSETALDVKYDPFGQVEYGPPLRLNLNSRNSFPLSRRHEATLNFGYLTGNLLRSEMAVKSQWSPHWRSEAGLEFSRTAAGQEELWLRLRSMATDRQLGDLALNLGYERAGQVAGDVSLRNQAVKNLRFSLEHAFARLRSGGGEFSRRQSSRAALSYTHRLFQLGADYSFHRDLLQEQAQGTPRFTLQATPFRLYGGLLRVDFSSSFLVNRLTLAGRHEDESRANLALQLRSEPLELGPGTALNLALAAEQLLDRERDNRFTSLGCVLKWTQELGDRAGLEFLYNFNTRRRSEDWLIQGTTSQDWSALLRLKESGRRLSGWVSLSYDAQRGRFTGSYLDCLVKLFKNWNFQAQTHYDFPFRQLHYDLYLIREAGRILVRASYRSLSRRLLLEILPR